MFALQRPATLGTSHGLCDMQRRGKCNAPADVCVLRRSVRIARAPVADDRHVRCVMARECAKSETVKVRIPAGVETGSRVRIPAKVGWSTWRAAGRFARHHQRGLAQIFTRKGDNIYVTFPLPAGSSIGSKIEVPTVEGKAQLRIPPSTQSGQKFRSSNGRAVVAQSGARGDQFVEVAETVPKVISDETKEVRGSTRR